jgi:transcriptional regulator with XRE-family HTH domain
MQIGNAIKLIRTQKKLSQAELAERADVSVSYISMLEREKRDPTFSTVEKLAEALEVPLSILMFIAAEEDEIWNINPELAEKLSHTALQLIRASANESSRL